MSPWGTFRFKVQWQPSSLSTWELSSPLRWISVLPQFTRNWVQIHSTQGERQAWVIVPVTSAFGDRNKWISRACWPSILAQTTSGSKREPVSRQSEGETQRETSFTPCAYAQTRVLMCLWHTHTHHIHVTHFIFQMCSVIFIEWQEWSCKVKNHL